MRFTITNILHMTEVMTWDTMQWKSKVEFVINISKQSKDQNRQGETKLKRKIVM